MSQIIKKHNKEIVKSNTETTTTSPTTCNCRKSAECPLNKTCLATNIVYKATVKSTENSEKVYLGLTEGTWKQRSYQHKLSFTNRKYARSTALSKHIWKMKDNHHQTPEITWSIEKNAPAYTNTSKRCILCLQEKMAIITFPEQHKLLNQKSELISKCRHENKFLLRYHDSND